MKIIINLTTEQTKGIKSYLKETGDGEPVTKKQVDQYIYSIVQGTLESPQEAVSDYIRRASK